MKDKKSFILYADLIHTVNHLTKEEKGELFQMILEYVNDLNPTTSDRLIKTTFEPIKRQLKRDLQLWVKKIEARSIAGRKGGLAKASKGKQLKANLPLNDTVTVTLNDKDLLIYYNKKFNKKTRVFPPNVKKKMLARIKEGYTIEDIKMAMDRASKDKFQKDHNFKYCTLEYFSREKTLDMFVNMNVKDKRKYIPTI